MVSVRADDPYRVCRMQQLTVAAGRLQDNNTYLLFNRDPVERMLAFLRQYFDPQLSSDGASLAITTGPPHALPARFCLWSPGL